jgi:double-stranded RNA-specific adenosine deaminase
MAANVEPTTEKKNIRHAEKRRTATCQFADRLAQVSIDEYRKVVPEKDRPAQTCLATIIAHNMAAGGKLMVVGLGVGTKFLGENALRSEASSSEYGRRVRDCHAEVLARRAFRRQLTLEIIEDLKVDPTSRLIPDENRFLERQQNENGAITYRLRPGITLHFYSSSAPCGNATLKKFSKMTKEKFRQELGPDQWPTEPHLPISDSSIHLGQFSLLIKKDSEMASTNGDDRNEDDGPSTKGNGQPALLSDDWTPPGTTIVTKRHKGSIHTCSDKLARWNYLGLQGSLLSSLLGGPLYLSSLSVGRKFTECICRRAICCRMQEGIRKKKRAWTPGHQPTVAQHSGTLSSESYRYNHPAVMGNAVYMDDSGVVETNSDVRGQDVRFHSSKAWCWWSSKGREKKSTHFAECLDGATGYLWNDRPDDTIGAISRVSTIRLVKLFLVATEYMQSHGHCANEQENDLRRSPSLFGSLGELILVKRRLAAEYEEVKDALLSNHPIFQQWRRRY